MTQPTAEYWPLSAAARVWKLTLEASRQTILRHPERFDAHQLSNGAWVVSYRSIAAEAQRRNVFGERGAPLHRRKPSSLTNPPASVPA